MKYLPVIIHTKGKVIRKLVEKVENPKPVRQILTNIHTQTSKEIDDHKHKFEKVLIIRKELLENENSKPRKDCEELNTEVAKLGNLF